jgi:hypothetical protein
MQRMPPDECCDVGRDRWLDNDLRQTPESLHFLLRSACWNELDVEAPAPDAGDRMRMNCHTSHRPNVVVGNGPFHFTAEDRQSEAWMMATRTP